MRSWARAHPQTISLGLLGLLIGLAFASLLWTRQGAIESRVDRVELNIILIQKDVKRSKVDSCNPSKPSSRTCRRLRKALFDLEPVEREQLRRDLRLPRTFAPDVPSPRPRKSGTSLEIPDKPKTPVKPKKPKSPPGKRPCIARLEEVSAAVMQQK